jgi:hypothetical protein
MPTESNNLSIPTVTARHRAGACSAACDRHHRRVMLTRRERERVLAKLVDLRPLRDRLAAALADEDSVHAYRDGDVVRLNDRITELTRRLEGRERTIPVLPQRHY